MSDSTADESCSSWGLSGRRSRKPGYSNIFSGVNIQQLKRLFQTAGDRNAKHRAQLVWGRANGDDDFQQADSVKSTEEEAGLAQALVGLRICARTKAGLRAEASTKEHKWYNASLHMQPVKCSIQIKDHFTGYSVMEEDINTETNDIPFSTEEKFSGDPNHYNSSSRRLVLAKHASTRDSDQYLHRILH